MADHLVNNWADTNLISCLDELKQSFTTSVNSSIDNLITPIHAQQISLSQQLQVTCAKLQNLETERNMARNDVVHLQRLVSDIRDEISKHNAFQADISSSQYMRDAPSPSRNQPAAVNEYLHISNTHSSNPFISGKKILGFGPIARNDIPVLAEHHSLTHDDAANAAIHNFLHKEILFQWRWFIVLRKEDLWFNL